MRNITDVTLIYCFEYCMNICFLKSGFWVTILLRSTKMLKPSTWSVQAGTAADRRLGPYFLPPRLTGPFDHHSHRNVLPELLQDVDPFMVQQWWCTTTFSACTSTIIEQCVSGTVGRTRWTNSMACAFPRFILLYLKTSDVYCMCYSSQWRPES